MNDMGYREHRAKHDAARGVKTRKPSPIKCTVINSIWEPPDLDELTVEHARNIVACIASPDKYTRIATWAAGNPNALLRVVSRALEVTP